MKQDQQALTPKHAAATLQFLQRAQLTGAEMPAYVEVFNVLSTIAQADTAEAIAETTDADV
ncbi:hypothetical protein [Kordiimonas sp.]|uniref:hypothetical protein n=1 Tax=Kordiimonas sp. TaxID=1970157 RepID=UPI003A9433BD